MKSLFSLLLIASLFTAITGCKDDPPTPVNPEELITTLKASFTPVGGGSSIDFSWQDLDGDGPNSPIISEGILSANTSYQLEISILNETLPVDLLNPSYNLNLEITEEALDHQFFFQADNGLDLSVGYADSDVNGNPIGLSNTAQSMLAGSGKLTITLRHQPDKNAAGVKEGDISLAGGETDIEVSFQVEIQ